MLNHETFPDILSRFFFKQFLSFQIFWISEERQKIAWGYLKKYLMSFKAH